METRNCQNCKKDFNIQPEDFSFYQKMQVPAPTFCPDCRFQRRLLFRNNRVFYRRECTLCNKQMLSIYSKDKPFTIYCRECWLSDKWDPMSYGRDYDFSRPFFEQFKELQRSVPRANMYQTNFVSSDYCNYGKDFKECYLVFGGAENERILFGNQLSSCRDSMDIAFSGMLEFCYKCFECSRSNKLFFSRYCVNCVDSYYLIDCNNCINCFGCVGLVSKQYHIFNKPYSKEEYEVFLKNNLGSHKKHLENMQKLNDLRLTLPHRYARNYFSVNSDGDDLNKDKNTHHSFTSRRTEDSKYLFYIQNGAKDCWDCSFQGWGSELCYEVTNGFGGNNMAFGVRNFSNQNARYNEECHDCKNIIGCEGLRKKDYCILNKQYSKEEYEELAPQIIKHMEEMPYLNNRGKLYKYGEFFPIELSPFSYNETIAQEYFPLSKEEILEKGYEWKELEDRNYKIDIRNSDIPDNIDEVEEAIVGKVIECAHGGRCKEQCTEAFKIVPEEFKFYKRMNLPLPRFCPNCRNYQLLAQRNPLKLWDRVCMCDKTGHFHEGNCAEKFKTTYSPDRPEIIYCEKCYQQEIY